MVFVCHSILKTSSSSSSSSSSLDTVNQIFVTDGINLLKKNEKNVCRENKNKKKEERGEEYRLDYWKKYEYWN